MEYHGLVFPFFLNFCRYRYQRALVIPSMQRSSDKLGVYRRCASQIYTLTMALAFALLSFKSRGDSFAAVNTQTSVDTSATTTTTSGVFKYPYSELLVWAILLRRQQMAKFMWQMGDEALAKVAAASFCWLPVFLSG